MTIILSYENQNLSTNIHIYTNNTYTSVCANCISSYNNGTDMVLLKSRKYFFSTNIFVFLIFALFYFTVKQKQVTKILDDCSEKLKQHQDELEYADKEEE